MTGRFHHRFTAALERVLPEQRLFLKSDTETRFIRLGPGIQAVVLGMSAVIVAWTIVATAILLMDTISAGSSREQARMKQADYERRLDALSSERDARAAEAVAAQERFATALRQVSAMQSALLSSEERRKELETGIGVIQSKLSRSLAERDAATAEVARLNGDEGAAAPAPTGAADVGRTLDFLTAALDQTAAERDAMAVVADAARAEASDVAYEMRLMEERHDEIFAQLEEAVTISMEPLDKMFKAAGMDPDELLGKVRSGYSGQGGPLGPLMPVAVSTKGDPAAQADLERTGRILEGLDRMNLYRIAAEKLPFAMPLKTSFRFTSGFGRRWGRLHAGTDLAGAYGSPVLATADGVVVHAGWESGYGQLVSIRHEFGLETRYGHLSEIRVKVGQKVSRGDRIGDMGNSGRSTGTHLHYEVRVDGTPINPMTYIKAATNVF